MRELRIVFYILCSLFYSCALQQPPEGGPKDVDPPKILSSQPENKSVNFTGKDIRIDFDEIVSITELSAQLIISPLLKYPPEIKSRKKSLFIHIKDTLRENTTYTLNFGSGIADNNEGNKLEDYQMIFSTGEILDSLSISGRVMKAFDLTSEKGTLVSLYQNANDSTPFLDRPLYFSKTNESGTFSVNNIAPGSYSIFAIGDKDANYLFSTDEFFAYHNTPVNSGDTGIIMRMFTGENSLRFLKAYSEFPGKASLVFNGPADSIRIAWITDTANLHPFANSFSANHDTLTLWYKNIVADTIALTFNNPGIEDTVILRLFKKSEGKPGRKGVKEFEISPGPKQTFVQHLHLPYYLQASRPVATADFSKMVLLEDSEAVSPSCFFTDSLHTNFELRYFWKDRKHYTLFIPPATFTDIYGVVNDTVQIAFSSHGEADYGSVTTKFWLTDNGPYILQLVDKDGNKIFREVMIKSDTTIEMLNLDPGEYRLKFTHDRNANGKWNTGNYFGKIQPEEVEFYKESVLVRGNWDVELQMSLPLSR